MADAMPIIDGHLTLAMDDEPLSGARRFTADDAVAHLDRPRPVLGHTVTIGQALVSVPPGPLSPTGDLEAHHRYLADSIGRHPDRFYGCVTLHPLQDPAQALPALRRLVADDGFRAVELHPTAQCFLPHRVLDDLQPLLAEATELGLPIFVHSGEPPFAFPTFVAYLAEAHPDAHFVIRNLGTQQVTYAREAIYVVSRNRNVYLETAWGSAPMVKEALKLLGAERLVFASDAPRQDPAIALAALGSLCDTQPVGIDLDEADLKLVLGANLLGLLGS